MASGTETRRRQRVIKVRCDADEYETISQKADGVGVSAPSYLRVVGLKGRSPRTKPNKPPLTIQDRKELAMLLAQVGKLGGNVNQIARALNNDQAVLRQEFEDVLGELVTFRAHLRGLLSQK